MRIGKEGQLKRSWPVAPGEFFRIYRDEPLSLWVEFQETHAKPRVVLCTDLTGEAGAWSEIDFTQKDSRNFTVSVKPVRCGIFQFKIKHSPDNGKTWFWDRVPFTKVVVDPAPSRDIRMYTLIPTASGTMTDWRKNLDHISRLGFNMVHLLPVTALDESESPYAASDLFSIDVSYIDPKIKRDGLEQFEDFVRDARAKNLRICVDLVLNHIGITSRMAKLSPEWITPDKNEPDGLMRTGCWHMNKWIKWSDLVKINYDAPEAPVRQALWDYMKQYALFWAQYAAYTRGMVRLDNLHASHPGFIAEMVKALRAAYPDLVIQAEFFSDSNTLLKTASEYELNLLLANPWEHPFAEDLREYLVYLHDIHTRLRFLTPVSTHDTGVPAQLYGSPDAAAARYFAVALMGTGATGFVQGTEHGASEKINFIGRNGKVIFPSPNAYNNVVGKINALHERYPLFHEGGNIRFVDEDHGAVLAALRHSREGDGKRFLVMANLDIKNPHTLKIDLSEVIGERKRLALMDAITGQAIGVDGGWFEITIEPCGMRAFPIE